MDRRTKKDGRSVVGSRRGRTVGSRSRDDASGACGRQARTVKVFCMTETVIEQETKSSSALDVPWNVVVHNDPVNLMSYVARVFRKVFGYSRQRAEKHMLEVHHKGRSILWTGARERAEAYVEQLHGHLLLATLEKSV